MKKFFGIFAVILALATSAFTENHKAVKTTGNSYSYDLYGQPGQDDPINMNDPANYSLVTSLSCPSGTAHRCGVSDATDDGFGRPDFTKSYTIRVRN